MSRFHRLEFDVPGAKRPAETPEALLQPDALHDADTHRRAGRFEDALRCYSRALEFDRSLVVAWLGQCQMLIQLGEYPEAELWSRKALEIFREYGDLMASRAQALCRMGVWHEAQPLSDASLAAREETAYRWMVRGEIMLRRNESTDVACFDKAQGVEADWLVPLEVARVYVHYRQFAKALPRVRFALQKATDQPWAWFTQAAIEEELGLLGDAEKSYSRCLELAPKHHDARLRLIELQSRNKLLARVKRMFRRSGNR